MALPRCHLVYAVAPDGMSAREANDVLNAYIGTPERGLPVFHDHFTGKPHGGFVVFGVRTEDEEAALSDPGVLEGWHLDVHALTFALTGVGFAAQTEFTIEAYGKTTLDELRATEPDDKRFWWREPDDGFAPGERVVFEDGTTGIVHVSEGGYSHVYWDDEPDLGGSRVPDAKLRRIGSSEALEPL